MVSIAHIEKMMSNQAPLEFVFPSSIYGINKQDIASVGWALVAHADAAGRERMYAYMVSVSGCLLSDLPTF